MQAGCGWRHSRTVVAILLVAALPAHGADVSLIGVFPPTAAVLVIDGSEPRTLRAGRRAGDVLLVSVESGSAVIEIDGVRRTIALGQHFRSTAAAASADRQTAVLAADPSGHFFADIQINGGSARFLVDTGATMVSLPGRDAERLGIAYRQGRRGMVNTANGPAPVYVVTLDSIKLGEITLHGVEAMVLETGLTVGLLGMSFLNRVEMRREGQAMTLIRRF